MSPTRRVGVPTIVFVVSLGFLAALVAPAHWTLPAVAIASGIAIITTALRGRYERALSLTVIALMASFAYWAAKAACEPGFGTSALATVCIAIMACLVAAICSAIFLYFAVPLSTFADFCEKATTPDTRRRMGGGFVLFFAAAAVLLARLGLDTSPVARVLRDAVPIGALVAIAIVLFFDARKSYFRSVAEGYEGIGYRDAERVETAIAIELPSDWTAIFRDLGVVALVTLLWFA